MRFRLRRTASLLAFAGIVLVRSPHAVRLQTPNAKIAGTWQVEIEYSGGGDASHGDSDSSEWSMSLKEGPKAYLTGSAKPDEIACVAAIKGRVQKNQVTMTWRVKPGCASETITFKGTYVHSRIKGSAADSSLGSGSFSASRGD